MSKFLIDSMPSILGTMKLLELLLMELKLMCNKEMYQPKLGLLSYHAPFQTEIGKMDIMMFHSLYLILLTLLLFPLFPL